MENEKLLIPQQLEDTPSRRDGVSVFREKLIREKSIFFIEALCNHHVLKW